LQWLDMHRYRCRWCHWTIYIIVLVSCEHRCWT